MKKVINLWGDNVPEGSDGDFRPTLTYYPAREKKGSGTAVICPGGAYRIRSQYEGEGYALFLNSLGLDAFVLDYRVTPCYFPAPLLDARRAMRYVRKSAPQLGIDPNKIAIMGSSAGGHLAALTSTYRGELSGEAFDPDRDVDCIPDGQILCYPVLDRRGHEGSYQNLLGSEVDRLDDSVTPYLIADGLTPPAFIWHTCTDLSVNVENTYCYATNLHQLNIPCELHVFPLGGHGLGLADEDVRNIPYVAKWSTLLADWLRLYGYLN